jgi:glycosyltransferase involved in cell wall biosynthesis
MRTLRPDIVVVHGYNAEVLGRAAAVMTGVPHTVVWVHQCSDIRRRRTLQRWSESVLRPMTTAYFGVAFAQIRYLTEELGHPRSKVRIIQNGVAPEEFRFAPIAERSTGVARSLGLEHDDLVVGIIAVMRPEKDHETFLRAARLVASRVPKARFLLVGRGPLLAQVIRMADQLGISDKVIFTGMRDDVPEILPVLDVFTLTSTTECFPMSILEAMAAGKPTVCTAVGGIPEIVDHGSTGYLVPSSDPVSLADRIVELLDDPERMREMGKAGRARVEAEFSLARSVRGAEYRLDEVAGRNHWTSGGR